MKFLVSPRQSGKTAFLEKVLTDYIKEHPETVIIRYQNGQVVVEKPVKQVVRKQLRLNEVKP
jgi:uncharacterized protein YlzI (FlbEa/FlbD family)